MKPVNTQPENATLKEKVPARRSTPQAFRDLPQVHYGHAGPRRVGGRGDGFKQRSRRLHQGHAGSLVLPDTRFQPHEGHRGGHRACRCLQCLFQDAERRPGREKDHHADYRRMYRIHCAVRGLATLLHVNHGRE